MDKLTEKLLEDYLTTTRKSIETQTQLINEVSELNKTLSNGAFNSIKKKLDKVFVAQLSVIVVLVGLLMKLLWR